jgi:cell division septation protein DedD
VAELRARRIFICEDINRPGESMMKKLMAIAAMSSVFALAGCPNDKNKNEKKADPATKVVDEKKPTEAKPTEAKPDETKPTEAKPTEAKPTEAKPEAKPAAKPDAKPAAKK